jgi:hypothetical protein
MISRENMPDSALNVYLRSLKLILADAEHELPPTVWRSLREVLLLAVRARVRATRAEPRRRAA